jgi:hypothetical protein
MEVGIPKTPEQLRQDSLAKVKAKNDRIKFVEDSIKTAKQKSKDQKEKAKQDTSAINRKEEEIFQE